MNGYFFYVMVVRRFIHKIEGNCLKAFYFAITLFDGFPKSINTAVKLNRQKHLIHVENGQNPMAPTHGNIHIFCA